MRWPGEIVPAGRTKKWRYRVKFRRLRARVFANDDLDADWQTMRANVQEKKIIGTRRDRR